MTPRALSLIVRAAVLACEEEERAAIDREGVAAAFLMLDGWKTRADDRVLGTVKAVLTKECSMFIGFQELVEFDAPREVA
jgi:hypothetical protein